MRGGNDATAGALGKPLERTFVLGRLHPVAMIHYQHVGRSDLALHGVGEPRIGGALPNGRAVTKHDDQIAPKVGV